MNMRIAAGLKAFILRLYLSIRGIALFILSVFLQKRGKLFNREDIRKILVIRMDRLGDFVVTTPLLKALKKEFPSSKITLLAGSDISALAAGQPWIDGIIAHDRPRDLSSFPALMRRIRREHFDLVIDCLMDYPVRTAILAYASGALYRLGFDIANRGVFFNLRVLPSTRKVSMAEETLNLLSGLGITPQISETQLVVAEEDKTAINSFLKVQGITGGVFIVGIHPGGFYPSQRWPAERFADLINRISGDFDAAVILLGGRNEEGLLRTIKEMAQGRVSIFYAQSLNLLAALIDRVGIFIGNNSGPLHMAAALKKKTVSTMGPTESILWAPSGAGHIVIRKDLDCSPCNRPVCADHRCMKLITVDDMFEAVTSQIEMIRGR